ncbi:MAG: GLPGLI family protein [Bacteroidetes bacterium]|nr:GLPGLI family protein [Bacteroidota bacterium]MCY4205204.1 GLPGLI family protein [Bacteroidota bacterium]
MGCKIRREGLIFHPAWAGLVLFVLLYPVTVEAQHGTVRYSHTRALFSLPTDQSAEAMNELFGSEVITLDDTHLTIARTLYFDSERSLMHPSIDEEYIPGKRTEDGADIGWEFVDSTYIGYAEGRLTESRKFYQRHFLVEDTLPSWSWKLEPGSERVYLGYRVMKATSESELGSIEAWFTADIPVQAGPGLFHGLPGLILMVTNVNSGEVYAAEEVDITVTPSTITSPVSGESVTPAKYIRYIENVTAENQRKWEIARKAIRSAM